MNGFHEKGCKLEEWVADDYEKPFLVTMSASGSYCSAPSPGRVFDDFSVQLIDTTPYLALPDNLKISFIKKLIVKLEGAVQKIEEAK